MLDGSATALSSGACLLIWSSQPRMLTRLGTNTKKRLRALGLGEVGGQRHGDERLAGAHVVVIGEAPHVRADGHADLLGAAQPVHERRAQRQLADGALDLRGLPVEAGAEVAALAADEGLDALAMRGW